MQCLSAPVLLSLLCCIISSTSLTKTDLGETYAVAYDQPGYKGASLQLLPRDIEGCYVLSPQWKNRISSVDVVGGCVDLCQDPTCNGPCRRLCAGTRGERNLSLILYDDNVSSFQSCTCPFDRLKHTALH